ncbi:MAG TPA: hypothetical protein VG710_11565 [Opitutus sp.]|nr:hypothetical protein [Opitutus sp.]
MLRSCRIPLLLALVVAIAPARGKTFSGPEASIENACRAQAMLGPGTWSRLIRIENRAERSVYPREVFALVFEFADILWFYTDTDGTQSFSLHRNDLAAEKADFGPLLRDIEPGFASYVPVAPAPRKSRGGALRNGCFIESIAALSDRLARGELISRAELLSYYAGVRGRLRGHTVLIYEAARGAFVFDPADQRATRIGATLPDDPLATARRLRPMLDIGKARWVPVLGGRLVAGAGAGRPDTPAGKIL